MPQHTKVLLCTDYIAPCIHFGGARETLNAICSSYVSPVVHLQQAGVAVCRPSYASTPHKTHLFFLCIAIPSLSSLPSSEPLLYIYIRISIRTRNQSPTPPTLPYFYIGTCTYTYKLSYKTKTIENFLYLKSYTAQTSPFHLNNIQANQHPKATP